jgi:hypothetical protein
MCKTGALARRSLQFFVAVFANYNYFREIFGKNVHVWILSINMLAKTKFREILLKQTKFRMEMEKDIFVSTLLQPNIRTLEPIEGDLEK